MTIEKIRKNIERLEAFKKDPMKENKPFILKVGAYYIDVDENEHVVLSTSLPIDVKRFSHQQAIENAKHLQPAIRTTIEAAKIQSIEVVSITEEIIKVLESNKNVVALYEKHLEVFKMLYEED